jgi:NAD(P)-dependent dehydrogenase (short-subunit alcohol dehydrogenase family)
MKAIFVSGAASGIGKATSLLFGRRGWFVGAYDIDVEGAGAVAEQIGARSSHGRLDVTSAESWRTAAQDFETASGGRMDVLFNCAGILRMGRFEEISEDESRKQLDVNVMGVILGIRASLPILEQTPESAIVNMSSASAIYGAPELAAYSASKFAVRALTEALDVEFRPKGIRVTDVMPGFVDTPMLRSQQAPAKTVSRLGVKLTAEDVAESVWKAAHGRGLHYVPQRDLRVLGRIHGLLPELGRVIMHRLAKV